MKHLSTKPPVVAPKNTKDLALTTKSLKQGAQLLLTIFIALHITG
jgi:hypothetical protein